MLANGNIISHINNSKRTGKMVYGCNSMVKHLSSMHKALGVIPSTTVNKLIKHKFPKKSNYKNLKSIF